MGYKPNSTPKASSRAFDTDNDDCIMQAKLDGILGSLMYHANDQEVRATMERSDKNKNELLSTHEFLELNTKDIEGGNLASTLNTTFEALDEDGSEVLIREELYGVVQNLVLDLSLKNRVHLVASLYADGDEAMRLDE